MAAKKAPAKKAAPKALPQTINAFGKRFSKESCSSLKTDATKKAEKLRADGYSAMVRKDKATGKNCVFKGPKLKNPAVSGTKKRKPAAKKKK
jgi:hypothetical protein